MSRVIAVVGEVFAAAHAWDSQSTEDLQRAFAAHRGRTIDIIAVVSARRGGIAHAVNDAIVGRRFVQLVIERRLEVLDGVLIRRRGGNGSREQHQAGQKSGGSRDDTNLMSRGDKAPGAAHRAMGLSQFS